MDENKFVDVDNWHCVISIALLAAMTPAAVVLGTGGEADLDNSKVIYPDMACVAASLLSIIPLIHLNSAVRAGG